MTKFDQFLAVTCAFIYTPYRYHKTIELNKDEIIVGRVIGCSTYFILFCAYIGMALN